MNATTVTDTNSAPGWTTSSRPTNARASKPWLREHPEDAARVRLWAADAVARAAGSTPCS